MCVCVCMCAGVLVHANEAAISADYDHKQELIDIGRWWPESPFGALHERVGVAAA